MIDWETMIKLHLQEINKTLKTYNIGIPVDAGVKGYDKAYIRIGDSLIEDDVGKVTVFLHYLDMLVTELEKVAYFAGKEDGIQLVSKKIK